MVFFINKNEEKTRNMKIIKNNGVSQEIIDNQLFLFSKETKKLVNLNKAAIDIWNLIEGTEKEELLERFLNLYSFVDEKERELAIEDWENVVKVLEETGCVICQE